VVDRAKLLLVCTWLFLFLLPSFLAHGESRTLTGTISCVVPAQLEVNLDQGPIALTIDPDSSLTDEVFRLVSVGTNAPPVSFGISLLHHSPTLSYRLTGQGVAPGAWKAIPILPGVSWESLPALGWTDYAFDLRGMAGSDLAAGVYQDDIRLTFQTSGIIMTFLLHVETTVLPRSPTVDAGPDQTVNEGEAATFAGGFVDPDIGETYTIVWDFGDGTTTTGTLTPAHTYTNNGTYTATLTVTDSWGRAGQDTLTVIVNDLGPSAHVVSVPPSIPLLTVAVDDVVAFDASGSTSSPDAIVSYEWDWNYVGLVFEPSDDTGTTATHVYAEAGAYTVAVRVTDDDGSTDIAVLDVEVVVTPATTTEVSSATPEVEGGGGGLTAADVEIDELYIHRQALTVSQFHFVSPGAPEEPSAPVIYFPFDEGSGEYAYNQIDMQSGTEPVLKGTLSQPDWVEGAPVRENAFALSLGDNGYVEIPADQRMSFSWDQDFTLEFLVRTDDSVEERPLLQRGCAENATLYGVNLFAGRPLFYVSVGVDSYAVVKGSTCIDDGAWHHVACIRESGTLKIYVDGSLADALTPGTSIAGAGGGNLSSEEPTYVGGSGESAGSLGGLVDASYHIGETIELQMRITDGTGTSVPDAGPSLLFIQYDYQGQKVSSGFIGRLEYNPGEEEYEYFLDTSAYEEGVYDFFLVPNDGSQQQLRIMLLEIE